MTRRITRAKQSIKDSGCRSRFLLPVRPAASTRCCGPVPDLQRGIREHRRHATAADRLAEEAIRLTRIPHTLLPDDSEVAGLLALMLLVHARRRARTGPDGSLITMADQDRSLWDPTTIAEGVALITAALPQGQPVPTSSRRRSLPSTTKPRAPK